MLPKIPPDSTLAIFLSSVFVVIVAELSCLVRTATLATRYGHPWIIFAGTMLGTAITMGAGLLLGNCLHHHVPHWLVRWLPGLFFIGLGLLMLFSKE